MSAPSTTKAKQPWASGPGEILQHGISLLKRDSDSNRRLAMLSIDNSVELMIKTYLGLPKRVTGLTLSRKEYAEISESFPRLLDALEHHCLSLLDGIDLAEIEWYHRLRNELYHQGNGLTVELNKVTVYAQLAQLLFQRLFGFELELNKEGTNELVGDFVVAWASLHKTLEQLAESSMESESPAHVLRSTSSLSRVLADRGSLPTKLFREIEKLRVLRNEVTHGKTQSFDKSKLRRVFEITEEIKSLAVRK